MGGGPSQGSRPGLGVCRPPGWSRRLRACHTRTGATPVFGPRTVAAPPWTLITPALFSRPLPLLAGRRGRTAKSNTALVRTPAGRAPPTRWGGVASGLAGLTVQVNTSSYAEGHRPPPDDGSQYPYAGPSPAGAPPSYRVLVILTRDIGILTGNIGKLLRGILKMLPGHFHFAQGHFENAPEHRDSVPVRRDVAPGHRGAARSNGSLHWNILASPRRHR